MRRLLDWSVGSRPRRARVRVKGRVGLSVQQYKPQSQGDGSERIGAGSSSQVVCRIVRMHLESSLSLGSSESQFERSSDGVSATGRRLRALGRPAAEVYMCSAGAKEEYESGWKMIAQSTSSRRGGGMGRTPLHWPFNAFNASSLAECRIEALAASRTSQATTPHVSFAARNMRPRQSVLESNPH